MADIILTINPGSTSTKISIFKDSTEVQKQNLSHAAEELAKYNSIIDQFEYRLEKIERFFQENAVDVKSFSAVVGRGGLLKSLPSGTYLVNDTMLEHLQDCRYGAHASNLGAMLADSIAKKAGCDAYIVDPVVVDELDPVARITGRPEITKKSIFHALNQKSVAKRFAREIGRPYEELNLIVAHLGGGISVGCHRKGQVVEVNDALQGEGPFSPERAGTVQAYQFADNILSNMLDIDTVGKMLAGKGGLVAYLGTNDAREVEKRINDGDKEAELVYEAMIYQVARYIAAGSVPVRGAVDSIIITGGIAYSDYLTTKLKEYIGFIAPVAVIPGENEMLALAEGAYRVLANQEQAKEYR